MALGENLARRLIPAEEIAGLEVSDSAVRLLMLSAGQLKVIAKAEANLPAGAIVKGEVKSAVTLTQAFLDLRKQAPYFAKNSLAILSLPASNFFIQVLALPEMAEASYEEAARLNANQMSPIALQDAYFDWQNVGVNLKTLEREILIGVAAKSRINPYLEALKRAGIEPIAVEPNSLGLIRLLASFSPLAERNAPHMIISLSSDGLGLVISRESKPIFDEYKYWSDIAEAKDGKITREDFETILAREVRRLIDFYDSRFDEDITRLVLLTPILKEELAKMLHDKFGLQPVGLRLPQIDSGTLADNWGSAAGAALRGLIPRASDTIISLMSPGTEESYLAKRWVSFISLWGKTAAGTLLGLVLAAGLAAAIVYRVSSSLEASWRNLKAQPPSQEIAALEKDVKEFNSLVTGATLAQNAAFNWSKYLDPIVASAPPIRLERLSFTAGSRQIKIQATSPDRSSALAFRDRLEATKLFSKLDMPISSFVTTINGVTFQLNLDLAP